MLIVIYYKINYCKSVQIIKYRNVQISADTHPVDDTQTDKKQHRVSSIVGVTRLFSSLLFFLSVQLAGI
jgi:hypothetical protein